MGVYKIAVYDINWKAICIDYKRFDDRQQAELAAEADCDWLGGKYWEVTRIR